MYVCVCVTCVCLVPTESRGGLLDPLEQIIENYDLPPRFREWNPGFSGFMFLHEPRRVHELLTFEPPLQTLSPF